MARYTKLHKNDIRKLASEYDLSVLDFEPMEGGAANSSYLLHTQQGDYVLTVFDDKPLTRITRLGQLLQRLAEYKFPTSRLLPPRSKDVVTVYRDRPIMVKHYIVGQVVRDLDKAMLHQLGAALAKLQQIPVPDFLSRKPPYGFEHLPLVVDQNVNPKYEAWAAEQFARLGLQIPPDLPRGIIHGDLFHDNALFVDKKLQAVIDFEEAIYFHKSYDLGMGIVGSCREGTKLALDKARALVEGYQQIRALEKKEKETLQLFVEFAATSVSCWRYWRYHVETTLPESADKHRRMMNLAKEVQAIPKAQFAEAVFGQV